jgi:DNA-binding response OmpR family regulator
VLDKQSIPVMLVDWSEPNTDGIELTEQLRAKGITDTYIIMLTAQSSDSISSAVMPRASRTICARRWRESERLARVHAAFNTSKLRRELRDTRAALAVATKHR